MTLQRRTSQTVLVASLSLTGVLALGCKSRSYNAGVRGDGISPPAANAQGSQKGDHDLNGPKFKGSPAFKETMEFRTPQSPLIYAPLTHCEVMIWAEADIPNWEVNPEDFANVYKRKQTGKERVYVDELTMPLAKNPKKKVSYAEAHAQLEAYLRYKSSDDNKPVERFVRRSWIQGVINYAQSRTLQPEGGTPSEIGPFKGTAIDLKPGVPLSEASLEECRTYLTSISSSNGAWGSAEHVIPDYLAAITFKKKPSPSGADGAAAYSELVNSELVNQIPFFSAVASLPDPGIGAYAPDKDPRRYVVPTLSFRTMKALSGFLGDQGKQKAQQDLAVKAICYFHKNPLNDYRLKNPDPSWNKDRSEWGKPDLDTSKWLGVWDDDPPHAPNADLADLMKDFGVDEARCAKLSDEDLTNPLKPLP